MFVVNPLKNSMIPRNNLAKLLSSTTPISSKGNGVGDFNLLTLTGGAATHAYFQYQHLHLHHNHRQVNEVNANVNVKGNGSSCVPTSSSLPCFRQIHTSIPHPHPLNNGGGGGGPGTDKERTASTSTSTASQNSEVKSKLDAVKARLSLSQNAYFEKYKEKFQHLEETSPIELLAKLEQLEARLNAGQQKQGATATPMVQPYSSKDHFLLNDVMELSRIKDLERDDIIFLWQEFHRKKEGLLAAVMSGSVCEKMTDLAARYPMFLLPLPREHGYEFLFVQYLNNAFHFTPLIAYQTHKENAPECFRLIKYNDLQTSKDLVLMRGEFDKNLMTTKDAHILAVQINFYYGETSECRKKLLESFFRKPDTFHHEDLIDELKKLQRSHPHLFEFDDD